MKKLLVILMSLLLILAFMAGCSSNQQEPANNDTSAEDTDTVEPITISLGHLAAVESSINQSCIAFKDYVEKESNGAVVVNLFPNGELGDDAQTIQSVTMGTLTMAIPDSAVLTSYSPKFSVLNMPYLFTNKDAGYAALDGELGEVLNAELQKSGIECLGYQYGSPRELTNNVKPVNEPSDLEGMKIRVMENPVFIEFFKALGANPIPMSFSELYTAMAQGTVDGQDNPTTAVKEVKFYEVQKYLSLTDHTFSWGAIIINKDFYEKLPDDVKKIIDDGVKQYLIDYQQELIKENEATDIDALTEAGMVINEITPENKAKFKAIAETIYPQFVDEIGQDVFDLAAKYNQ